MDIVFEINLTEAQHNAIKNLRNHSFPKYQVNRSYYKQLPHMRALQYEGDILVGYLGLDYRVIKVGDEDYKANKWQKMGKRSFRLAGLYVLVSIGLTKHSHDGRGTWQTFRKP